MKVWMLQIGEPIVGVDPGVRPLRCNMLGDALLARGHQVRWWTSTFNHFTKTYRYPHHHSTELKPGLVATLIHATPPYRSHTSLRRVLNQRCVARGFQIMSESAEPPDLLFACLPTPEMCEEAVEFGRRLGIPVVIDVRDMWPDLYVRIVPQFLRPLGRLVLTMEYRRIRKIFADATAITAVSQSYLEWALAYARRTARRFDAVFPLGYPSNSIGSVTHQMREAFALRHGLRPAAKLFAFTGTFGVTYDLNTILETARGLIKAGRHDIQFVLAGDGDQGPYLRQRAAGLESVVFAGWLDQTDLRILMSLSTAGLCAYATGAPQSLPNKPFEYMSAGLPQISSLPGELEKIIAESQIGLQYTAGDADSLRRQILRLVDSPDERNAMAINASKLFHREFAAGRIYPRLAEHLEQIATAKADGHLR
jgi:glycosyltransferase involved in cell wall biosynthesis